MHVKEKKFVIVTKSVRKHINISRDIGKKPQKKIIFKVFFYSQLILKWSSELNNVGRGNTVKT